MGYEHSYCKGIGKDSILCVLHQQSAARPKNYVFEHGEVGFSSSCCSSKVDTLFLGVSCYCNDGLVVETSVAQTRSFWPLGKMVS